MTFKKKIKKKISSCILKVLTLVWMAERVTRLLLGCQIHSTKYFHSRRHLQMWTKCHGSRTCSNTCVIPMTKVLTTNSTEGKPTSKSSIPKTNELAQELKLMTSATTTSPWLSHLFFEQQDKEECEKGDGLTQVY